jgi:DNA polymerase-4
LAEPIQTARALFATARALLKPELGRPYRLIGVGWADVQDQIDTPATLFASDQTRVLKTEVTIDALRARFGTGSVMAGRALKRVDSRKS